MCSVRTAHERFKINVILNEAKNLLLNFTD
jgi:hypothetical protein